MKILSDSEAREKAVSDINACLANTAGAEARMAKAQAVLDSADLVMTNLRKSYTTLHGQLVNAALDAPGRTDVVRRINEVIAQVDAAKADVQKAKSEHGTASAELQRLREQLLAFTATLNKYLPTDLLLQADA